MNTCIQCKHFNFRAAGEMANHGFGWCANINEPLPNGNPSYAKTIGGDIDACGKFERAAETDISQRIIWRNKKRGHA